jgi:hypothetical protein
MSVPVDGDTNTDLLFKAGFFTGERTEVPAELESFVNENLSELEVASLISVKEHLDRAGISFGTQTMYPQCVVVF